MLTLYGAIWPLDSQWQEQGQVWALRKLEEAVLVQHGQLLLWAPVCLGMGIGLYFALPVEPAWPAALTGAALMIALLWQSRRWSDALRLVARGAALVLFGLIWTCLRAQSVAQPVLPFAFYGPVEGRVARIDRSGSDAIRLVLDQVHIPHLRPAHMPTRLRISLHGKDAVQPPVGARLRITAKLSPPGGPVEPGGFDFQRHAWFRGLGAVGYARAPPQIIAPPQPGLATLRARMAEFFAARMAPREAAFARAITTGDRSGLTSDIAEPLRRSNLAHLLAISGLHMGLLTGVALGGLRLILALPGLRRSGRADKKWAALGALGVASAYLALSGGAVATERAYIMVVVMLGAVLLERRAISLRAVAVAALLVLLRRPEALVSPGFQMSFAATTALVVVYRRLSGRFWRRPAVGVLTSSFVAGAATAPFAAAHFNVIASYGLVANLLSVPVMGVVVMPLALLALVLAPLGWAALPLRGMEMALWWISEVALRISSWPGAVHLVPAPAPGFLAMVTLAGLGGILLGRWIGLMGGVLALALALSSARPPVLVSETGRLVGILGPQGRAMNKARGDGFAATVWLENDGDGASQDHAAARGFDPRFTVGARRILYVGGAQAAKSLHGCAGADIVISDQILGMRDCLVIDPDFLRSNGAVAITNTGVITAKARAGRRIWNTPGLRWGQ